MTTITIKEDLKNIPKEFKGWDDLQDYVLNELRVQIKPLHEDEISAELIKKVQQSRKKFQSSPESFDDIPLLS